MTRHSPPLRPQIVRPLDETDLTLLTLLEQDGRLPNNALAAAVGIAPSTCLARVRTLRESGALRGVHAEVSPTAVGLPVQAMVAVQLGKESRAATQDFAQTTARAAGVVNVYFVSGSYDFLVQVAMPSVDALRTFVVDSLSSRPEVASTETHLVFEHVRGRSPLASHRRSDG